MTGQEANRSSPGVQEECFVFVGVSSVFAVRGTNAPSKVVTAEGR